MRSTPPTSNSNGCRWSCCCCCRPPGSLAFWQDQADRWGAKAIHATNAANKAFAEAQLAEAEVGLAKKKRELAEAELRLMPPGDEVLKQEKERAVAKAQHELAKAEYELAKAERVLAAPGDAQRVAEEERAWKAYKAMLPAPPAPSTVSDFARMLQAAEQAREDAFDVMVERVEQGTLAILDDANVPVGVAFAVTKKHLLTAHHNIPVGHKRVRVQLILPQVQLVSASSASSSSAAAAASSASSAPIWDATLVGGDQKLDWAVLSLAFSTLSPVPLWGGTLKRNHSGKRITLCNLAVGLFAEDEDPDLRASAALAVAKTSIQSISPHVIIHGASTLPGDGSGLIILNASGHVIALHIAQLYQVPGKAPRKGLPKRSRSDEEDDLRSSLSGSTANLSEAVRVDYIRDDVARLCAPEKLVFEGMARA